MSWFTDLSKSAQAAYIKSHPNSKYAKGGGNRGPSKAALGRFKDRVTAANAKASGIKVEGGLQRTGVKTASKLPAALRKGTAKPKVKKLDNSDDLTKMQAKRTSQMKAALRREKKYWGARQAPYDPNR